MPDASAAASAAAATTNTAANTAATTGTSGAADAIAKSTEQFTDVFNQLISNLSIDNIVLQGGAVVLSALIGYFLSRIVDKLVDKARPEPGKKGFGASMRRFLVGFTHNVSFSFISGSILAVAVYALTHWFGYSPGSMVIARLAYSIFYAYALLSLLMAFLQGVVGLRIITLPVRRVVSVTFWVLAVLQFFGILTDAVRYLDSAVIPIGGGKMTVWTLFVAIVTVLLTLAIANWLANMVHSFVNGLENMQSSTKIVLNRTITVVFMILAVIIALGTVGIDLTILSVFSGAVGVGVGFGLQKIASNYISGFIILLDKSIKIGDLVTVGGFAGEVTEINTRFTVVRNFDGIENIVPNEYFVTSAVLNQSYSESACVRYLSISVSYAADVERALQIMLEEGMRERPRIVPGRRGWAYLDSFGDSGINLKLGFWVKDPANGTASLQTAIGLAIYERFKKEGIEVPYNQLEINLRHVDAPKIPVEVSRAPAPAAVSAAAPAPTAAG
jgi:small-conductance mechanosensitive channel